MSISRSQTVNNTVMVHRWDDNIEMTFEDVKQTALA